MEEKGVGTIVFIVLAVCGFVIGMVCSSFSDLHYWQMGFSKSTTTGAVDTSQVYEGGRHWIGPAQEFKSYESTAHVVYINDTTVFTSQDKLEITIDLVIVYFLVSEDLHLLHDEYDLDYEDLMQASAQAAIKNTASTFTLNQFYEEREEVEQALHQGVQEQLGGLCCAVDCSVTPCAEDCISRKDCTSTDKGLFADVRYFQLTSISIPYKVESRNLATLVLTEETVKEQSVQEAALITRETDRQVDVIENESKEVQANATALAALVEQNSKVNYERIIEEARMEGLEILFSSLGLTDVLQKNSFDYLRSLSDNDNAHLTIDFDQLIMYSGKN